MNKSTFQILAVIYELLGEYDAATLRAAGLKPGLSKNVRRAILSLAGEAKLAELSATSKTRQKADKSVRSRKPEADLVILSPNLSEEEYQENLFEFFMSASHFRTRSDLIEFVARIGYALEFDNKASRQRVAKQIVAFASKHPDFREALHRALTKDSTSQTEGWLKLIRSET